MGNRFDNPDIVDYDAQAASPAAPKGLRQAARGNDSDRTEYANRFTKPNQQLQAWLPEKSYVETAQSWYTGANAAGQRNGWDNQFLADYNEQWHAALDAGVGRNYFDSGTGVVTWDHTTDSGKTFEFGDVVKNGEKVSNVYDDFRDRRAANLMMLPWIDDGTNQRRLWEDAPGEKAVAERVDEFVRERHADNNENFEKALGAMEFQGEVDATKEKFTEGSGDELLAGGGGAVGGAITGGSIGGAIGAFFGGVGAVPGAIVGGAIGGVVGGIGGLLNKDEIAEQAVRAHEISELGREELNGAAAFGNTLSAYAGFSTKLSSPLTQAAHGLTDWVAGDVGDGESARYAVDKKGESTAPLWSKVADWSAMVGDGLAQFGSPLNRAIYTAQMGGTIAGEVTQLATSGTMFDPREGGFDNIFVDDDGHFDPTSAAAGILKVGIDAVQLGGLRGLAAASAVNKAGMKAGEREVEHAGHRFLLGEDGRLLRDAVTGEIAEGAVKKKLSLLAPSEQIAWASATRDARVAALKEGRAVTADDFYKAASGLATGSKKLKIAVVNALGEGYEEFAQTLLEPVALDGQVSGTEAATAFAYGAAAGLGMSLGATLAAPGSDQQMMAQAYVIETIRRDGVEPGWEQFEKEWASLTPTEKRVRAARSAADAEATRAASQVIARDQAATMVASEVDASKAMDARRKAFERGADKAAVRTDRYHVMSGLVDVGRVDSDGNLIGDTAPAEAVEMSARTVLKALSDRLRGFDSQIQAMLDRAAELDARDNIVEADAARSLAASLELGSAWGSQFVADLSDIVDAIYDETLPEADRYRYNVQLNQLLRSVFEARASLTAPDGVTATEDELKGAAAHFVSLIQSREPKLDTGSYLALLPRASWQLTRDGSDNFVEVNTDILQAINGDFDGDKLRAENQLVLTPERFLQARAGQNFGGAGRSIDIAVRNFDEQLTVAVGRGLRAGTGAMFNEATATMAAIRSAITNRYGSLMSPEAMSRVFTSFEDAVNAGSEDARHVLLNGLAREAGQAITDLGRTSLRNEWLWISKVVRANFNAYQTEYRKLRNLDEFGNVINAPSDTEAALDIDTPEGTNARKRAAANDAQTLALWAPGNTLFRKFQKIHYTFFNSPVLGAEQAERPDLFEMARVYEELSNSVTRIELARAGTDDTIAARVLVMLSRLVDSALETEGMGQFNPAAAMSILANVKVKDVWFDADGPVTDGQNLSLAQVLLKRALDADREEHKLTFDFDETLQAKHARLRAMTISNDAADQVNAQRAFIEIFKGIQFGDSLGGNTGALAMHTTPEQWLRDYQGLDFDGRQDMERLFKNVPEYLDRDATTDPPYSFAEAKSGAITAYRSMMDAMIAVGRAELTFDPSKPAGQAFSGRKADQDRAARSDYLAMHAQVRNALLDFRRIRNRKTADRGQAAKLVQQMFEANPAEAAQILGVIPEAAANAIYEFKDGELYVAPWVYEMFAIESSEEALFFYWKNLTLAQWNATRVEGRAYDRLNTRFGRLLYELAKQPGQAHLEILMRKLNTSKSLDEFFVWLNTTPGYRGRQAPLLPFVDDVADFDSDASAWGAVKPGSDLRAALTTAKTAAGRLRETMAFRENSAATDRILLDGIKRAHSGDPAATDLDRENLAKLQEAVATSLQLPRGFAPSAALALTRGVVRGFAAHSHDKGQVPTPYEGLGEFQALMDAFAFVPGLERVMETLTAHSLSSLRSNLGDTAKHGGTAMDANGRQIEWAQLDVDQAIALLDDPATAPLAHLLLTPKAMDVSPMGLSERLLMEANLKDLLDGGHYEELFRTDAHNQLDTDTRYLMMADAYARTEGGSFDAIRVANDLAVAMTSGLGKRATPDDEDRLTAEAYHYVATVLRMVGNIQATPAMRDSGTLPALREAALKELREQRKASALPSFTDADTGTVVQAWVDDIVTNLDLEFEEEKNQLARTYQGAELTRRVNTLTAQHARNKQRIESMLDDNVLATTVARFELTGDAAADAAQHARIVEYVMASSNFPARAPEATAAWTKLAGQRRDGLTPDLTAKEWDTLARAAMGVTLVDDLLRVATHVSIPSLPKAPDEAPGTGPASISDARFYKYFDQTFSFIVDDLLGDNTPLTRAAVWLHTKGNQPRQELSFDALRRTLQQTVLSREAFGPWTPGLMSQLVAGQERMDSAGAPPGIAAAGNGPKRWATVAAATRRRGEVPDASLLTSASFTGDFLDESVSPFSEFAVNPAGTVEQTSMPVAMLENRFFASIKVDGQELDLDADNLGFRWDGADEENPYRYVSLERLRPLVARYAAQKQVPLSTLVVEVEFFHPDSQPAGAWHNAFFEGMSHSLIPDGSESLIATLWSDNGGQISADTQWTIDSGKKGLRAIQPFRRLPEAEVAAVEALWDTERDLAAVLRRKTELAVRYDDGSGAAGVEAFNAMHKIMKLQHLVVTADGQVLTADEALAIQAAEGKASDTLAQAKLVKLSPDVLRSMLGDTSGQGVNRFFDDELLLNPDLVDQFTGITPLMMQRFGQGWTAEAGELKDTSLRNVGQQRVLKVRTMMPSKERNARTERRIYLDRRANETRAARNIRLDGKHVRSTYAAVIQHAIAAVGTERTPFEFGAINAGIITPRNLIEGEHTGRLLETFQRVKDAQGLERGFIVRDEGAPDYATGVLTFESLNDSRDPEDRLVKDDVALLALQSFQKPERKPDVIEARVAKALDALADSGAYIVLGSGDGGGDLRYFAARHLESLGYVRINGSKHLYGPAEFVYQTQNERAYESTLSETRKVRPARSVVTFLSLDPIETDENNAILNPDSTKLRDRRRLGNLIPSAAYSKYNVPIEDNRDYGLYSRTLNHLRGQLDPANVEARATLLDMVGEEPGGPADVALTKFHTKISERGSLELEVGDKIEPGDIIPFVHPDGKVLLYRHGMKLPGRRELDEMHAKGLRIALAKSETDPQATANAGTITEADDRVGYGKRIQLEVPLQPHGDKVQLEWNGMKYVLVPKPDTLGKIPRLFANQMPVDLISDVASADAKEAFGGRVLGYRNALTFFQWDFSGDMVEFFFPGSSTSDADYSSKVMGVHDLLWRLANQDEYRIPYTEANMLAKANVAVGNLLGDFAAAEAATSQVPDTWVSRLQDTTDATSQIARAMITYLLTPGANLDNVWRSAGFSHPRAGSALVETREVPGLFADLLDNGPLSAVHDELISRFDRQLLRNPDGSGFKLHSDWTVEMFNERGESLRGYLQFGEAHSSGDNPVLDGQAFDPTELAGVSPHNAMAANLSFGAITAHEELEKYKAYARSFTRTGDVVKFGDEGDGVWEMLTALPDEKDLSLVGWRRELPAETVRRSAAREENSGFYQPLNTEGWNSDLGEETQFSQKAVSILDKMGLHGSQRAVVDAWVRDKLGRPHAVVEGEERGIISFGDAMQALIEIEKNIDKGLLPHAGSNMPLIDINHLTTLYLANLNKPEGARWVLRDIDGSPINDWDGWVEAAFGTAWIVPEGQVGIGVEPRFHLMYQLAMDGRMHGYQNATTSTRYLPVSSDILRQRLLMDEKTNKMLVSISADENLMATDPTLWQTSSADLEDILIGQRIYGRDRQGRPDPAGAMGRTDSRHEAWHKQTGAPRQVNKTMRGIRGHGNAFVGYTTTTSGFFRSLMNLRVGNTLFNLSLAVSAPFEAFYRRTIGTVANLAVGESTGMAGRMQSNLAERFAGTKFGEFAEQLGVTPTYTPDELKQINKLVSALSSLPEFKALVYKELWYQYPSEPGIGPIEKWLERYAKFGAKLQDPAWGMLPKDLARIYVESALRKISRSPVGGEVYSVGRLLTQLARDPNWLLENDREAHNMAIAAISQVRSVKPNVLSLGFRGFVEPLSENPKFVPNAAGNMLKVLTAFQNFWANFGTTVSGLQGPVDFMAFMLDGRKKRITARMQAALRGEEYNPDEAEYFDMSEVLESIDLADSFIKGGVTHAGLFALGMMASGLGLSGEDDEMKFRRRQAELQGVPVLHDPRDFAADFRNKDTIYLNWLPFGMDSLFRADPNNPNSEAVAHMNWVSRTFLSPIIGFERFFETGDFSEVFHGFKDAVGSHPIVNQALWNSATDTAAFLHEQSVDAAEKGDYVESGHLLITAVGVLESMLFENSMVNLVYIGRDEWDRDPYVLPLRDSDGVLQRDIEGNARPNDLALQSFIDEASGKVKTGYLGRSQGQADARVLTENRATMAFVASLFSGGIDESDFWRYNMPIKTREIEKAEVTREEAEAYVKAAAAWQMAQLEQPNISDEEALKGKVRQEMYDLGTATGQFFQDDQIWSAARAWAKTQGGAAASILASDGHEELTSEGAKRIYRGLRNGAIEIDDLSQMGVYIPWEMRNQIADEWSKELVQEGINLGLSESSARYRMKRLMSGPYESPEVPGLGDLLFDTKIPSDRTQTYGQLNTAYVMGPDGRPWATGFKRDGLLGALGLTPFKTMTPPDPDTTGMDIRGNTVDLVHGNNTGLRALVPFDDTRNVPTDVEIAERLAKAIKDAMKAQYTPAPARENKSGGSGWRDFGNGWRNFGRGGYGGYGGSYGGGGGYFTKMYGLPDNQTPYGNSTPFINSSNPILRRAFIRRERISSERGRLNQWQ